MHIHQRQEWPNFYWDSHLISPLLTEVRNQQGRLLGRVVDWGFDLKAEASMESIVQDVLTNSEIEGEILPADQVRSSVARKLGLDIGSGSQCNPSPQRATPATRDNFLIKGNQRKKRRTKFRPSRKILSKSHPFPAGIRFWGEGVPK
jgi:hypothetical protein